MNKQEMWNKVNTTDNYILSNVLLNLYERWQDEKEYEDINDYLMTVQKSIPETYAIHRRPFGIDIKCDNGNMNICIKSHGCYTKLFAKAI